MLNYQRNVKLLTERQVIKMTLIFAHRGSKGTHPENTMAAFREAVNIKSDGIELDVQFSLDEELVIIHDGDVNRTTNGKGLVKEKTLAELKVLDAGSWFDPIYKDEKIPTFNEVIELLVAEKYTGILNIEIKTDEYDYDGIEARILNVINSFELPFKVILSSFNTETMARVIALDSFYEKAIILDKSKRKIEFGLETSEISGLHPSIKWIEENVDLVKTQHKAFRPWTVNSEEQMKFCFDLGLAGIHTDFPKKAMALKESYS